MADANGWTGTQILLTMVGVFGLLALAAVALFLWNRKLSAGREQELASWAEGHGLTFTAIPDQDAVSAPKNGVGPTKITNLIRGESGGQRLVLFDAERRMNQQLHNIGTSGSGGTSPHCDTFMFVPMAGPLPRFVASTVADSAPHSAGALAMLVVTATLAAGLKRVTEPGLVAVALDQFPGLLVQADEGAVDATRGLLARGLSSTLAARVGWRVRAEGDGLLVSWCRDIGRPNDTTLDADQLDEFIAGARALAENVRSACTDRPTPSSAAPPPIA